MGDAALLAQLVGQARAEGADLASLRAIVEEAGDLGAARAIARLGLSDAQAERDLKELRELLAAWRDAKRSAVKAVVAWIVRMLLAGVLVGIAMKAGFGAWVK